MTVMWLHSGRLVDPWNLAPALADGRVALTDIAHALARINRWTGHTRVPISVAAHAIICARTAVLQSRRLALLALHHEDGEAFFNDLPWAIKTHPAMAAYRDAEHLATRQCVDHFCPNLRGVDLAAVKPIDVEAVKWEMQHFLPRDRDPWEHPRTDVAPLRWDGASIWTWSPSAVAGEWLRLHAVWSEPTERP